MGEQYGYAKSMLYAVGTHIDLSHLNKPEPGTQKPALFQHEREPKLYTPGTYFLFVKNFSQPPQVIIPAV